MDDFLYKHSKGRFLEIIWRGWSIFSIALSVFAKTLLLFSVFIIEMKLVHIFLAMLAVSILIVQTGEVQAQEKPPSRTMVSLDSRNTLVDENAVGIFGLRFGYRISDKWEAGLGFYSSRLFRSLGKEVEKPYTDNALGDIESRVGFGYGSIFGEYELVENNRWRITANTQFGMGQVVLRFDERSTKKEGKTLMEHSIKAKYAVFSWLDISAGVGYRYLLSGAPQIQDAFNAPIYIIGAGINFRQLLGLKSR